MPRNESDAHIRLKQLALDWARARGFAIVAPEVRVPRSGYRADVAGAQAEPGGLTAIFECKQSRADLLKDAHAETAVRARLAELEQRRITLETMLATHCPELRRGEAFWPEDDTWDFSCLEHRTYRRVVDELACLRRRVREGTKFSRLTRWRAADRLFLVLEENLHAAAEIPEGWSVLVRRGEEELQLMHDTASPAAAPAQRADLHVAIRRKLAGPAARTFPVAGRDLLFLESA